MVRSDVALDQETWAAIAGIVDYVAEASDKKTDRVGEIGGMLLDAVETMHGVSETVDALSESVADQRDRVMKLTDVEPEGVVASDGSNGEPT